VLFAADHTMSIMLGESGLVRSEDLDASVVRALGTWFDEFTPEGRVTLADAVVNEWNNRRRASAMPVYTRDLIDHVIDRRVRESAYVNEALIPNGITFWQGVYGRGPGDSDAILWVSYRRPEREPFGEAAVPLLSLLAPAFQAGLDALVRLGDARAALDELAHPLIVFDREGREVHRTAAFVEMTRASDGEEAVVARARSLARGFAARRAHHAPTSPSVHMTAGGRDFVLRVSLLPEGLLSGPPAVAVLAQPLTPPSFPDATQLAAAFGLTPRETEVTLHLARGATREQVAQAMGISPHTARAHTEKVFAKLGVVTRSAVAAAILKAPLETV
jgi:DNA-binding CsgD family transcriptional regulator